MLFRLGVAVTVIGFVLYYAPVAVMFGLMVDVATVTKIQMFGLTLTVLGAIFCIGIWPKSRGKRPRQ